MNGKAEELSAGCVAGIGIIIITLALYVGVLCLLALGVQYAWNEVIVAEGVIKGISKVSFYFVLAILFLISVVFGFLRSSVTVNKG